MPSLPARPDGRPTLTACIICQDSARALSALLPQLAPVADELLLVDGGSTDDTADIVAGFASARLITRAWDGNHCRQRNAGWAQARGDWILFLDTDERLSDDALALLPSLLASPFRSVGFPRCWLVQAQPPRYLAGPPHFPDLQYRLFRNAPGLRWDESQPIHGQVGPKAARAPVFKLRRAPLLHLALLESSRGERERKVSAYESAQDDSATRSRRFYLYEEAPSVVRALRSRAMVRWSERARLWWKARGASG